MRTVIDEITANPKRFKFSDHDMGASIADH